MEKGETMRFVSALVLFLLAANSAFALDSIQVPMSYGNIQSQPQTYPMVEVQTTSGGVNAQSVNQIDVYVHDTSSGGQTYVRACYREQGGSSSVPVCGSWASSGTSFVGTKVLYPSMPSGAGAYDGLMLQFYFSGVQSAQRPWLAIIWDF